MTTIAYDGKTIAVDSRVTANGIIVSDSGKKFGFLQQKFMALSGPTDDVELMLLEFKQGEKCSRGCFEVGGFMIDNEKVYRVGVSDGLYYACDSTGKPFADGSGMKLALAAMDMGKTAEQAVKYAMTRCVYTGGHVHVFCAKTGKKLK